MTKLIQRHEAAEMVGVTRQTIQNWIDKGVIKSKRIGKTVYVSIEAIEALAPDIKSIEESRRKIEEEEKGIDLLLKEYKEKHRQLRADLKIWPPCAESAVRKEFYLSLIDMLGDNPEMKERERRVLREIIDGNTLKDIGYNFGLTNERVRQIAYKTIRRVAALTNLRALETENKELKTEITAVKSQMVPLKTRIAELEEQLGIQEAGGSSEDEMMYKILVSPVSDFNFSVRALNCMKAADIETIGELVRHTKKELMSFRNFGRKSFTEIEDFLLSQGLFFGYDVDRVMQSHIRNYK